MKSNRFGLLSFLLIGQVLIAQPVVPDLKPNEVVIRSKKPIELPKLERPAITNLVIPPKPFMPREGQTPFIGGYKQNPTELPHHSLADVPVGDRFTLSSAQPRQLLLKASVGRYLSRELQVFAHAPFRDGVAFFGDIDYLGSDGHQPFEAKPDIKATFANFKFKLGSSQEYKKSIARLIFNGFSTRNNLFGADTLMVVTGPRLMAQPFRKGRGLGIGGDWYALETARFPFKIRADYQNERFDSDILAIAPDIYSRTEKRMNLGGEAKIPIGKVAFFSDAHLTLSAIDAKTVLGSDLLSQSVRAGITWMASKALCISTGLQYAGFEASKRNIGTDPISRNFFAPYIRADYYFPQGLQVFLKNDPRIIHHTTSGLFTQNPYLIDDPIVKPSINTIAIESGIGLRKQPYQFGFKAGYTKSPEYLYFQKTTKERYAGFAKGVFESNYALADVFYAQAEAGVTLFETLWASVTAKLQNGRLIGSGENKDTLIPHEAAFESSGSLVYTFLKQKARLQADLNMIGTRYASTDKMGEITPVLDLGISGSYQVWKDYGVYAQVKHISASPYERWAGYPEARFVVMLGVKTALNVLN
ncbi:MAG TPA: hypothetical protein PLO56_14475 [Rhodothermales bacterium]|nr:hypothetical protein [Rhodothermales bacterium]